MGTDEGWQPIKTAPRDGSEIIICRKVGSAPAVYAFAHWDSSDMGYPWMANGAYYEDTWPTHWRHRPDEPTE